MQTDVVVVGAGPTGLALACGLGAAGVAVRVLDSATAPAVTRNRSWRSVARAAARSRPRLTLT